MESQESTGTYDANDAFVEPVEPCVNGGEEGALGGRREDARLDILSFALYHLSACIGCLGNNAEMCVSSPSAK